MLNCSTDGFQFFRQKGFEGWPITATPVCLMPDERNRNKYQLLLVVIPGPKQPVDLESFRHPIAKGSDELGKGVPGLIIPDSATPTALRAGVLNFTTDQPGGDALTDFKGTSSYIFNRLRTFKGFYFPVSNHICHPPQDPMNGYTLFKVQKCPAPRRTAATISANAAEIVKARAEGSSVAFQTHLEQ